jgi:hypothetical protein
MATNTNGVYDTTCGTCGEEIWIIPSSDGIHITYPVKHYDQVFHLQETKKPSIKDMAWQLYQAAFDAFGQWTNMHSAALIGDPESIRLAKQVEACRNAWLACSGSPQVVIGKSTGEKGATT